MFEKSAFGRAKRQSRDPLIMLQGFKGEDQQQKFCRLTQSGVEVVPMQVHISVQPRLINTLVERCT